MGLRSCSDLAVHFAEGGKMVFQSSFMLMTIQPFFFASAVSASLNVPIFESAPEAYSRLAAPARTSIINLAPSPAPVDASICWLPVQVQNAAWSRRQTIRLTLSGLP